MNPQDHWNALYRLKGEREVSWFEAVPAMSLEMLEAAGLTPQTCVLDVGGGDSRLVDALLARGVQYVAVLDVAVESLERARTRLGPLGNTVTWIDSDVTDTWTSKPMDIWHDRAMFHFLRERGDRAAYVEQMKRTLKPNGSAIIATFATDGPEMCSGLPVVRYSPETLAAELGSDFALVERRRHSHLTPKNATQSFQYSRFRRLR
jgi:ubiquinone/menaquinone biosynthesis C-methylase UbiE